MDISYQNITPENIRFLQEKTFTNVFENHLSHYFITENAIFEYIPYEENIVSIPVYFKDEQIHDHVDFFLRFIDEMKFDFPPKIYMYMVSSFGFNPGNDFCCLRKETKQTINGVHLNFVCNEFLKE